MLLSPLAFKGDNINSIVCFTFWLTFIRNIPGSFCNHYFLRMLAMIGRGHYDAVYDVGEFTIFFWERILYPKDCALYFRLHDIFEILYKKTYESLDLRACMNLVPFCLLKSCCHMWALNKYHEFDKTIYYTIKHQLSPSIHCINPSI